MGMPMGKRVMVIGCSGSGKTTFSIALGGKTGLPVIHLDSVYWQPGWVETSKEVWREKQRELLAGDGWIADGNYTGSLDVRLEKADTVVFLDYNRYVCLYRVLKRRIMYAGKAREDRAEGCPEKIDWPFVRFVWRFPLDSRGKIYDKLGEYKDVNVIVLKTTGEANRLLRSR